MTIYKWNSGRLRTNMKSDSFKLMGANVQKYLCDFVVRKGIKNSQTMKYKVCLKLFFFFSSGQSLQMNYKLGKDIFYF